MRLLSRHYLFICVVGLSSSLVLAQSSQTDTSFEEIDALLDEQFNSTEASIDEQFERVNRAIMRAFDGLTKKIEIDWQEDIKVPTATEWVTYSSDMKSRVAVDFEDGMYVAEVLVQNNDLNSSIAQLAALMQDLQQARDEELNKRDSFLNELEQQLIAEDIIEIEGAQPETDDNATPPLLESIVSIPDVETLSEAVEIAVNRDPMPDVVEMKAASSKAIAPNAALAETSQNIAITKSSSGNVKKLTLQIRFVNNYQEKILTRYLNDIKRIAKDFDIDVSTVLAIMETESSFNPRATSPVPAFGLMQVVPSTAGIDAYRHVYGEKKLVSAEFLYDELNNILMGTAYFNLLDNRYLRRIKNGQSRFYCAVASYNTGVGNLAKTFVGSKDIKAAAKVINTLSPDQVYNHLLENLPAQETRNYLKKITSRAEKYKKINWDAIK